MLTRSSLALLVAAGLFAVAAVPVPASQARVPGAGIARSAAGIQVTGRGEARVAPDEVVVTLRIRTRETSPLESYGAFKQRRALFDKAMEAFDDVALKLEPQGVRIGVYTNPNNQVWVNGQPQEPAAPFETKESVMARLTLGDDDAANIDLISQLIQAAVDVECSLDTDDSNPWGYNPLTAHQSSAISYRLTREALVAARSDAIRAAMADALEQAQTLAELSATRLGPVESIAVVEPFPESAETSGASARAVTLSVRFALME